MVGGAAALDPLRAALGQHRLQRLGADLERDVQVEVVLRLELERQVGGLEEGQVRAVVEAVEGVQRARLAAGLGAADLDRVDQRQAEEILVEAARLLRVAAAVGVVVQLADHGELRDAAQTVTIGLAFSVSAKPSITENTCGQLFSAFIRPSQALTFGYAARSLPITSARATYETAW